MRNTNFVYYLACSNTNRTANRCG